MRTEKMKTPTVGQVHVFLAYIVFIMTGVQCLAMIARGGPIYPVLYVAVLVLYTGFGYAKTLFGQSESV